MFSRILTRSVFVRQLTGGLLFAMSASVWADDFVWNGKSYIPIPAVFNQDVIISFPEPVVLNFQQPSAVDVKEWDEKSVLIRPTVNEQEQRVLIKGKKTGKTYYGKVSSRLPFVPFRNVVDGTVAAQEERAAAAGTTALGLMKAMMTPNGIPPQGFDEASSQRVILDTAPYRITAHSVWTSPSMVGITATLSSTIPNVSIQVVPTNIQIRVPEFGSLKVMGADYWELTPDFPSTRIYLVFSR